MNFENVDYNEMNEDELSELATRYEFRGEYEKKCDFIDIIIMINLYR